MKKREKNFAEAKQRACARKKKQPSLQKAEKSFSKTFFFSLEKQIYGFECLMLIWGEKSVKLGSSIGAFLRFIAWARADMFRKNR